MSAGEIAEFRRHPDWREAILLRRIDDRAKVVGLAVPGVEAYRDRLLRVVGAAGGSAAG